MQKKLTISIDEVIYNRLHQLVGRGSISKFIIEKIKPFLKEDGLAKAYKDAAKDSQRKKEAKAWAEINNDGLENLAEEKLEDWV